MTQDELDILCVNSQSMAGFQGWEMVEYLRNGDPSSMAYISRHMALHGCIHAIKDVDIDNTSLTDQQLYDIQAKINMLLLQDKNVWDNSMPYKFNQP